MASFITTVKDKIKARYRLDVNRVVKEYDAFLQYALVTTSSFQDIVHGKLNRRRRALQLAIMVHYCLYLIPRYSFIILLYFQDEKTRMHYQYILADYAEEMHILGRTLNFSNIIFPVGILLNYIVLRKFEAKRSLEFLTDWLKRVPKKTRIDDGDPEHITAVGDLDNKSRHKLISGLHYKLIFARIMARNTCNAIQSIELIAFSVFIYKRRPSFFITCLGLWNWMTMLIVIEIAPYQLYSLYLSYVVTTDYFKLVINNIIRKVKDLKTKKVTNQNVTCILDYYDAMMTDYEKYNRVLKPLLANLVHFYIFGLTLAFFAITIKTEVWMMVGMIFAALGFSIVLFATGMYITQLNAKVTHLQNNLVSLSVRHARGHRKRLSLKCMFRLKHVIQELGSLETNGQFVIGLRDGEGAATSRMEIFKLTTETVTNTLMIFGFINGINSM